jgi:cell wall-associated NlpC family hydrolase
MAFTFETLDNPERVEVFDGDARVATFTLGCYTVTMTGPERTFAETFVVNGERRLAQVTHTTWVRAAPGPVTENVDQRWLRHALAANDAGTPDVLALGMQYVKDAPPITLGDVQIAGDASYGPLQSDGSREEGSDFNDYLGLRWLYPSDPLDLPELRQKQCLDCSGYIRMIWGFRHHLPDTGYLDTVPLCLDPKQGLALPRRAVQMCDDATGIVLIENTGEQVTNFGPLEIGDLLFFDADDNDGDAIDHVGMYLGIDANGRHRFISSRKTADGPTLGDVGGPSLLDGTGLFARSFRAVRRL